MPEELEQWRNDVENHWVDYVLEQGDSLPLAHATTAFNAFRAGYGFGYDEGHAIGWQQAKEAQCSEE